MFFYSANIQINRTKDGGALLAFLDGEKSSFADVQGVKFLLFACEVFVAHHGQAEDHPAVLIEVHAVVLVRVQVLEDEVHGPLVVVLLRMTRDVCATLAGVF